MSAPGYVRAVYDFNTVQLGELELRKGDVVQVLRQVDENWLSGNCMGKVGNFPCNFVEELRVPPLEGSHHLYAAIKAFPAEQQGDLNLKLGDLVIGLHAVDQNWWHGRNGSNEGIFPVTHVYHLQAGSSTAITPQNSTPAPIQKGSKSIIAKAIASMDLKAQFDELGFRKGDIINIFEAVDADFAIGECEGRSGSFPLAFVEIFEGELGLVPEKKVEKRKSKWWEEEEETEENNMAASHQETYPKIQQQTYPKIPQETYPQKQQENYPHKQQETTPQVYQPAMYPQKQQETTPQVCQPATYPQEKQDAYSQAQQPTTYPQKEQETFPRMSEHAHLLRTKAIPQTNGNVAQPQSAGTQNSNQSHKRMDSGSSYTQENTRSHDAEITAYGQVKFDFIAENDNELTLFQTDIVTLIQHVDDQWIEGEFSGKRGIFPASFVEVIVDCPWAQTVETPKVASPPTSLPSSPDLSKLVTFPEHTYGRVLYTFIAESPQDLNLEEGDTVTLVHQMDDFWYEAMDEGGNVGFCPIDYIDYIKDITVVESGRTTVEVEQNEVPVSVAPSNSESNSAPAIVLNPPTPQAVPMNNNNKPVKPPPPMKPKPILKPKPDLKSPMQAKEPPGVESGTLSSSPIDSISSSVSLQQATSVSVVSEPSTGSPSTVLKPPLGPPPAIPARICDKKKTEFNRSESLSSPPVSSPGVHHPPPFTKSRSIPSASNDPELDSLIEGQLQEARSRSSSVRSDGSSGKSRSDSTASLTSQQTKRSSGAAADWSKWSSDDFNVQAQPTVPTSPSQPPFRSYVKSQTEKRVAFSKFYMADDVQPSPPRPSRPPPSRPMPHGRGGVKPVRPKALVPQRPAPPRPVPPGDLMAFSPESESGENAEVLADLDKRIAEIQADLQKYEAERLSLQDNGESEELEFCQANIKGLTEELQQLKENIYTLSPTRQRADQQKAEQQKQVAEEHRRREQAAQELVAKRRDTRERVIHEIVQTEKDYLLSLSVCMETFVAEECPAVVDYPTLFGQLASVTELSQTLLNKLEEATGGVEFDEQIIGQCFVMCQREMKATYAPYCRNHDDVIAVLEKHEEDSEVQAYFTKQLDVMREQHSGAIFDLGSVLIKPVQRVLKYPLLLNELSKNTEEDHPDKMHLLAAINCMTDVASAINEFKRRKDLVRKYKEEGDSKLSDKFAKLNVHSTKKKFLRLSQKMVGIQTIDADFNLEERKFKSMDNAVKLFVRDIAQYLDHIQGAVCGEEAVANDFADYYSNQQQEVAQFCRVHNQIASRLFPQFKSEVQKQVLQPLHQLMEMLVAPHKVMKKRYDKLLDYDNITSRLKDNPEQDKQSQTELDQARNNYLALNAQLLEELPELYTLSRDLLTQCLQNMVAAQNRFYKAALEEMYQMLGPEFYAIRDPQEKLELVLGDDSIVEVFNVAHVQAVDKLSGASFIPKAFNPRIEEKKPVVKGRRSGEAGSGGDQQSSSQAQYVRQRYPQAFVAGEDYPGGLMMDLPMLAGTVVGVIKEGDPMGNKERWYVDNGAAKGFVPRKVLKAASALSSSPSLPSSDLLGLDPTVAAPSPIFNQSAVPLQPSPIFNQSAVPMQPSPVFNQSAVPLQPSPVFNQSAGSLPSSPGLNQSGSSLGVGNQSVTSLQSDQSSSSLQVSDGSPVAPPRGRATPVPPSGEMYQAVYDFAARNALELTIEQGQLLHVIQTHDNDGNTEWWLAANDRGQRGYVPATYVYKSQ